VPRHIPAEGRKDV